MAQEIAAWLRKLGLDKYGQAFADNDIDLRALPHLTEADLRELGVSLGHRKILLAAIGELAQGEPAVRVGASAPTSQSVTPPLAPGQPAIGQGEQAERRLLCVFFCDLVDSTAYAQSLDPEDMRTLLRSYQDRIAGAVTRYGGHVAQYLGDGVMAFFGWPTAYEDQAERAVRAGLEALEAVQSLAAPNGLSFQARVGIASGRVVVGDLSSAGRHEGAIAGETPNLAARLQGCVAGNQIAISEAVRNLIGESFEIEDLGTRSLKGFDSATQVYRVVGARDVESRFDAAHGATLSQFVGRVQELAFLHEKWGLARAGEGQVVLISGEAGIGKSRLIRAFTDRLHGEPHSVWRLQGSPYHSNSALFPVIQGLQRAVGLRADDTVSQRLDKLESMLKETAEHIAADAPVYADLLSLETGGRYPRLELPPQELKTRTLRALIDRCLLTAKTSPLLLIVEDAHWIDPTTKELLEQTLARLADAPMMMVVTHRPEWQADWSSNYGHVMPLALGRLAKPLIAELVASLVGRDANDILVAEIASRTDGVPLFVEELSRSLLERAAGKRGGVAEIPATLQGSLMARLDALPAMAKDIIQAASVIGREFPREMLARVCERNRGEIDAALEALVAARLIVKGGMTAEMLTFRHALIQDAAYQSLLRGRRQRYHEAIAQSLIETQAEVTETQPELVAHHFREAGLSERALPYLRRSGDRALARSANYEAVDHFENAVQAAMALADSNNRDRFLLAIRTSLGEAQMAAGLVSQAIVNFGHSIRQARELGDTSALVAGALGFDVSQFHNMVAMDKSIELLNEVLVAIDGSDASGSCKIMSRLTRAYYMIGNVERAEEYSARTIEQARRLRDDRSLIEVLLWKFVVPERRFFSRAEMQVRHAQMDEMMRSAERLDDADVTGRVLTHDLYYSAECGDRARMVRSLEALTTLGEARHQAHQYSARHGKAMLTILDGDFSGAERLAEEAFEIGSQSAGAHVEGVHGMQMFTIRREQGRLAEVAPIIKRFIDENPDETAWRPGFALIACDLGFKDPARRKLGELAETGFKFPVDAKRSTTLAYVAEVCAALDEENYASAVYGLLAPYRDMTVTTGVATICYGSAGRFLGMLADVLGQWDQAEELFEEALLMNRDMAAWPWLAHTQRDMAHMLRRRGRTTDIARADILLGEAWTTAERLGMVALKSKLRAQQH
jgi:class 3 adenylate cyclase/tetratricopeptide (TPR) repeat protein/ABC-type transport system involved in cytochrome c biogenesis ATPase subunit